MNQHERRTVVTQTMTEHGGPLLRYAMSLARNQELAKDAVQDTFLKLFKAEPLPGHLVAWLFKVCRNRVFEIQRKERPMITVEPQELHAVGESPSPDQAIQTNEMSQLLTCIVSKLPDREQELIRLKFQNGLSYLEMSEITGLSVSNIGFILHQTLKTLRQHAAVAGIN